MVANDPQRPIKPVVLVGGITPDTEAPLSAEAAMNQRRVEEFRGRLCGLEPARIKLYAPRSHIERVQRKATLARWRKAFADFLLQKPYSV